MKKTKRLFKSDITAVIAVIVVKGFYKKCDEVELLLSLLM